MLSRFSHCLTGALLSAAEEICCSLWKAKAHYRAYKSPPLVLSCAGWIQPTPPRYFFKIHFSIILSSMPRSFKLSLFNVTGWLVSSVLHLACGKLFLPPHFIWLKIMQVSGMKVLLVCSYKSLVTRFSALEQKQVDPEKTRGSVEPEWRHSRYNYATVCSCHESFDFRQQGTEIYIFFRTSSSTVGPTRDPVGNAAISPGIKRPGAWNWLFTPAYCRG